ncbi:hypothetical protein [Williamsia muralis]|uniref:MinD-like ATPase involved in chromosome partitioning or flagellar assembly n=1 Tax=Williamsia marianensis TaxID=85044 RepID=A0ABU4F063_WILMA|nr:hypothetical protein [Williamsia muralis]MDV7136885.1 hypothetical protein [Williamsia muralis]
MTATNSPWGWLDNNEPTPAAVVPLPQRPRSVPTVAVIGAAGGAGVSVLSVLVADARARAGQSVLWLDAAATPGDVAARIASPDAASEYSAGGALLRSSEGLDEIPSQAISAGGSVIVDAGVVDKGSAWLTSTTAVVLVIAARPDTANRSRSGLQMLAAAGVLTRATAVVACLDPWASHLVGQRLVQSLTARMSRVLLWDYDPHLGTGGPIDPTRLASSTTTVVEHLAGLRTTATEHDNDLAAEANS